MNLSTRGLTKHLKRAHECQNPAGDLEGVIQNLGNRPRLDQPARMRALRTLTLEGRTSHETHKLLYYRGIYMCAACGLVAHREISYKIVAQCKGEPRTHYARQNKRNLRKLKPPINFSEFPIADRNSVPQNLLIPVLSRRTAQRAITLDKKEVLVESDSD